MSLTFIFLVAAVVELFAVLPGAVQAQFSEVTTCQGSGSQLYNSRGQNPCLVASVLLQACTPTINFTIYPLPVGNPPYQVPGNNLCVCNPVSYNMVSACEVCQGAQVQAWVDYMSPCLNSELNAYGLPNLPEGISVPSWAYSSAVMDNPEDMLNIIANLTPAPDFSASPTATVLSSSSTDPNTLTSSSAPTTSTMTTTSVPTPSLTLTSSTFSSVSSSSSIGSLSLLPTSSSTSSASSAANITATTSSSKPSFGMIIVIVVGTLIVGAVIVTLLVYVSGRRHRGQVAEEERVREMVDEFVGTPMKTSEVIAVPLSPKAPIIAPPPVGKDRRYRPPSYWV